VVSGITDPDCTSLNGTYTVNDLFSCDPYTDYHHLGVIPAVYPSDPWLATTAVCRWAIRAGGPTYPAAVLYYAPDGFGGWLAGWHMFVFKSASDYFSNPTTLAPFGASCTDNALIGTDSIYGVGACRLDTATVTIT